jgi:hypothetical protein
LRSSEIGACAGRTKAKPDVMGAPAIENLAANALSFTGLPNLKKSGQSIPLIRYPALPFLTVF